MNNPRCRVHAASDGGDAEARRPLLPKKPGTRLDGSFFRRLPRRMAELLAVVGVGALVLGAVMAPSSLLLPPTKPLLFENSEPSVPLMTVSLEEDQHVDERDHMRAMHDACVMQDQAIIPWRVGLPRGAVQGEEAGDRDEEDQETTDAKRVLYRDDPRVPDELRRCPDVDIYLPSEPRELGYCEDGSAFATYLESRLLPHWVLEDKFENSDDPQSPSVSYHELCPDTPMLVFNHYWDAHEWPNSKPVYMVPSIETPELTAQHFWRSNVVLCRTEGCRDRVSKWYEQQGSLRDSSVVLTKQASLDATHDAQRILGAARASNGEIIASRIAPKDFSNRVRFTHMAGSSHDRGTAQVLQCWVSRPDLPPLDVYMHYDLYDEFDRDGTAAQVDEAPNVNVTVGHLDPVMIGHILAESAFFLCPSTLEGYGHYINQARAAGGVIVTTDAHPMNELITSSDMGVFVKTKRRVDTETLLGGAYKGEHGLQLSGTSASDGLGADFGWEDLCDAVDFVLHNTTVRQRELMSTKAQRAYHDDTKFFARRMLELREFAREHLPNGSENRQLRHE